MTNRKLQEIESLRGIAMLAVVAIHVFNAGLANLPVASRGYGAFYYFHNFLNFAVPTFVFISAMMASYTHNKRPVQPGVFYQKKILRVGLPYLFWSCFYLVLTVVTHSLPLCELWNLANWPKWFLCGKAYTHLYFMAIILQFYLLFPLLFAMAKKVAGKPFLAAILALGPQIIIYWLNKLWLYTAWPYFHSSFAWYYCIAFTGLWLGLHYHELTAWLDRHVWWITGGFVLSAGIFLYYKVLSRLELPYHTFPYTMDWQFFVLFTALLFLCFCRFVDRRGYKLGQVLSWIGTYSFGIYLIHPIFTFVFSRLVKTLPAIPLFLTCTLAVLVITIFSGLLVAQLQKWQPTAYLFGAGNLKPRE